MEEKRAVIEINQPSQGSGEIKIGTRRVQESQHPPVQPCVSVCTLLNTAEHCTLVKFIRLVFVNITRFTSCQPASATRFCAPGIRHGNEMT